MLSALRTTLLALGLLSFAANVAPAQPPKEDDDPKKVSNDQPTRPLQMPAATSEVREAFDDFERFKRRGAWERASKALYAIPEAQATRFVDGQDNFIIPVARKAPCRARRVVSRRSRRLPPLLRRRRQEAAR